MKRLAAAISNGLRRWQRRTRQPLFQGALMACAGILLADRLPASAGVWALAVAVGAAFAAWRWRSKALVLLACGAAFASLHAWYDRDPLREQLGKMVAPGAATPATVAGLITDAPEPGTLPGSYSFPLRVEKLDSILITGDFTGTTLYVHLSSAVQPPQYGDRIAFSGLLRRPQGPRNPGEFDLPAFLRRQSMGAEFEATAAYGGVQVVETGAGNPVTAAALRARDWIGATVTEGIGDNPEIAATVRAMVLGTREKTPSEVEDAFKASGTMHVFAVSGLHVAMFCLVVFWLLRRTPLPYGWILAITLPLVFFYVFITGLRPSAWRAAMMGAVFLCAPLFDRESRMFNSLGASALLLLAWNTQQLFQPGFSLSFGVILAIGLAYPWFRKAFRRVGEPDPFLPQQLLRRTQRWRFLVVGFVRDSICLSLASTIGSMPLMIYYFSLITPIGIFANIFIVLLSNVILVVACASLMTAPVGLGVSVLCNHLNSWLAMATVKSAQFFAAVPWGHMNVHPSRLWRGEVCEITVLELDHGGGALHVDTPEGHHWMVDTGGLRHFGRSVRPHLTHAPVNQLDGLLLSHTDSYHTSGAENVRRIFQPAREPALRAGEELTIEPGVVVRCLFPPAGWNASAADDRCAVYLLTYRGTRVLIMNDAGFVTEKALLAGGEDLRADILIKGRHGSDFSGLPEFINAVHPQAVVFTNDTYPEGEAVPKEWAAMVEQKGARVFDQHRTGAVIIRMDREGTMVTGFCDGTEFKVQHPR